ncbi:SH3 domain-containing protein [Aureimonas glaciei]|uniref:SH3b domain-containing protein n=1 Tax=Aureimonas glaciei TaxID=1776957 RepID=A0A916Y976_9HYPH|nr:SH3 domain-containing protein [Aureimonas glaciei]GGD35023.1 hypothetical protein GCM10011335_42580 [Aureimonas glaciei]
MRTRFTLLAAVALAGTTLGLGAAQAATAIATTNVNLRAGPSTQYPAVDVVRRGEDVRVFGCLETRSWCDVGFRGIRGWMSSNYIAVVDVGRRYTGPEVVGRIGAPIIGYSFGRYWDDNYRDRSFYRDRGNWDRWDERRAYRDRHWDRRPDWDRRDRRDGRRWDRDDRRGDRDDRRGSRD